MYNMRQKMNKDEGLIRDKLLATKAIIENVLAKFEGITEEKESVTLRIAYEAEREQTITIPQSSLCGMKDGYLYVQDPLLEFRWSIAMRTTGPLAGKAFLLNEEYDWELGKDTESRLCLVPIKKER